MTNREKHVIGIAIIIGLLGVLVDFDFIRNFAVSFIAGYCMSDRVQSWMGRSDENTR